MFYWISSVINSNTKVSKVLNSVNTNDAAYQIDSVKKKFLTRDFKTVDLIGRKEREAV